MEELDRKKLQKKLLSLTKEVDRICRKNNITYCLIGGSTIGAVRHKGFIPWDDDMDIGFLREDYNRFLAACKNDLNSDYFIQTCDTDENYIYAHAKLVIKHTVFIEEGHEKTKEIKGIFIDLFPFDHVAKNKKDKERQKHRIYLCQKLLRQKCKIADSPSWSIKQIIFARCLSAVSVFISKKTIMRVLLRTMTKYNEENGPLIANMSGLYGFEKETIPAQYFEELIEVPFENEQFYIMKEYDAYLKHIYGDYMVLPPVEKRVAHKIIEIVFNDK